MKSSRSSSVGVVALVGTLGAGALIGVLSKAPKPVHAATRTSAGALGIHPQVASREDQRITQGFPPNLDWAIFFPAGEGQFQASVYCVACHSAQQIVTHRSDTPGWTQIVRRMVDMHSAPLQPEDVAAVSTYLGQTLGPSVPVLTLPIHINTAPKDQLSFLGSLSADQLQKVMDTRSKGKIKDFPTLQALVGDKSLDKYKDVLAFD